MTTKAIWRSRSRRRAVMIVTASAATIVERMVGKENDVLGSHKDIRKSDFFNKIIKYNDSHATHQFVKALAVSCKRRSSCK